MFRPYRVTSPKLTLQTLPRDFSDGLILGILRSSRQTADGGTMHPWEADRLGWILGRELEDAAA